MKTFRLFAIVLIFGMLGGSADRGWCQYPDEGWYENKSAEDFVRWGDRISRYKVNWRKAIHAYERALELDPGNARAHMGLARVFLQREEYLRAADEFEAAFAIAEGQDARLFEDKSQEMDFYITAAGLMINELNQPDRARPFIEKAKEIYPDDSRLKALEEESRRLKESGAAAVVEGFLVHLDVPQEREQARPIISILEEARRQLFLRFDFAPRYPIPLEVLTRLSFEDQVGLFLAGSPIGSNDRIVIQTRGANTTTDIFREILLHQFGRTWMRLYLEGEPPGWLSGGFAVWVQKLAVTGDVHVPEGAAESYGMVNYLIEQSTSRFRLFLEDLKTTRDTGLTLQSVYGITLEELQRKGKG